ncbi:hypothetical protein R1flu_026752 [Riccia fluitans]|uniref:Uncharacterized protein n=1 Tax=Riccia fluitans TaxID=41844 RepID=A0ABD1XGU4_9MARC
MLADSEILRITLFSSQRKNIRAAERPPTRTSLIRIVTLSVLSSWIKDGSKFLIRLAGRLEAALGLQLVLLRR